MSQTQIQCGTLSQRSDKGFDGVVRLIGRLDGALQLNPHPNAKHGSENHPDYVVCYMPRGDAGRYELGVAWLKNHPNVGDFLSMQIEHPDWANELTLTAFPPNRDRGEKDFRIVWSRPRGARVQDQAAS